MFEEMVELAQYALIIVFALIQLFLALRPSFIWGLFIPLIFGFMWYYFGTGQEFIPYITEFFNESASEFFIMVGTWGLFASASIYIICRLAMLAKKAYKNRKKRQRIEAKHQRQVQAQHYNAMAEQQHLAATYAGINAQGSDNTQQTAPNNIDFEANVNNPHS